LGIILRDNHSNTASSTIITQNVGNSLNYGDSVEIQSIAPDATRALQTACKHQKSIGWDQWIYGQMTKEWETFQNHDIKSRDSGIKFNTSKKWAKSNIL
jgi:hypothetical protein